jgi:hypothetical protein
MEIKQDNFDLIQYETTQSDLDLTQSDFCTDRTATQTDSDTNQPRFV